MRRLLCKSNSTAINLIDYSEIRILTTLLIIIGTKFADIIMIAILKLAFERSWIHRYGIDHDRNDNNYRGSIT